MDSVRFAQSKSGSLPNSEFQALPASNLPEQYVRLLGLFNLCLFSNTMNLEQATRNCLCPCKTKRGAIRKYDPWRFYIFSPQTWGVLEREESSRHTFPHSYVRAGLQTGSVEIHSG